MIRPRWRIKSRNKKISKFWPKWDKAIAALAAANLAWIIFDASYLRLRSFWIQLNLRPISSTALTFSLNGLPNIISLYDKVKGIEPHKDSQNFIKHFSQLDLNAMNNGVKSERTRQFLKNQINITKNLLRPESLVDSENTRVLNKVKKLINARAKLNTVSESSELLLSQKFLDKSNWDIERKFWINKIIPLLEINNSHNINERGQAVNKKWLIDLPFQLLFLVDIFIKTYRLKKKYYEISWRESLLRRWIDLPLILPIGQIFRIIPVIVRLSRSGLIQLEPLRAVVSRTIVAVLALEIFEIITIT